MGLVLVLRLALAAAAVGTGFNQSLRYTRILENVNSHSKCRYLWSKSDRLPKESGRARDLIGSKRVAAFLFDAASALLQILRHGFLFFALGARTRVWDTGGGLPLFHSETNFFDKEARIAVFYLRLGCFLGVVFEHQPARVRVLVQGPPWPEVLVALLGGVAGGVGDALLPPRSKYKKEQAM